MLLRVQHNGLCGKQSSRHGTAKLPDTRRKQPMDTATSSGPFCSPQLLKFTPTAQVYSTCLSSPHLPEYTPTCLSIPPPGRVYPHLAEYTPSWLSIPPPGWVYPHLAEYTPTWPSTSHVLAEYIPSARVHPTCLSVSHLSEFTPTCLSISHLPKFTPPTKVYPICLSSPYLSEFIPPVKVHPTLVRVHPPAWVYPTCPSSSSLSEFTPLVQVDPTCPSAASNLPRLTLTNVLNPSYLQVTTTLLVGYLEQSSLPNTLSLFATFQLNASVIIRTKFIHPDDDGAFRWNVFPILS